MSIGASTRRAGRCDGRALLAGALGAAALVVSSCSSSSSSPLAALASFVPGDCLGELVELARFSETFTFTDIGDSPSLNNLAIGGDTLFLSYAFGAGSPDLSPSGGIVAVPTSGGSYRLIGAPSSSVTAEWAGESFWVTGDQIRLQNGTDIQSIPVDPASPTVLLNPSSGCSASTHDDNFGYCAQLASPVYDINGLTITKTPIAGGAPTVMVQESLPNATIGGMADAGDALLLQLGWHPGPTYTGETLTAVWRIPKDGTPHSDVRPDVQWANSLFPFWLAWDGANIFGTIDVQNVSVPARVSADDLSSPEPVKLRGVVTKRGDEILTLQTVEVTGAEDRRLLVATSKGSPGGSVLACGASGSAGALQPAGIVANDSGIYVSYVQNHDSVLARVGP